MKTREGMWTAPSHSKEKAEPGCGAHPYSAAFPLDWKRCPPDSLTVLDSVWKRKRRSTHPTVSGLSLPLCVEAGLLARLSMLLYR